MARQGHIRVVGPRDPWRRLPGLLVNTTSHAGAEWSAGLSPFNLGPCAVTGGRRALCMENAWQFSKVGSDHLGLDGEPSPAYWRWAEAGWSSMRAVRYPRGKGWKPAFLYWHGEKLGYVPGRLRAYWPLYRDAVRSTESFRRLRAIVDSGQSVMLFDFDGYDHESAGVPLRQVLLDDSRPMGHAFVLKALLLFGEDVTPEQVLRADEPLRAAPLQAQRSMF